MTISGSVSDSHAIFVNQVSLMIFWEKINEEVQPRPDDAKSISQAFKEIKFRVEAFRERWNKDLKRLNVEDRLRELCTRLTTLYKEAEK